MQVNFCSYTVATEVDFSLMLYPSHYSQIIFSKVHIYLFTDNTIYRLRPLKCVCKGLSQSPRGYDCDCGGYIFYRLSCSPVSVSRTMAPVAGRFLVRRRCGFSTIPSV